MDHLTNNLNSTSRRHFMKSGVGLGLIIGVSSLSVLSFADTVTPLKVVVVGGGYGGATAAKYLKLWGKTAVDVTMIEPKEIFMSPIMSGMVVTSQLEVDRISFTYDRLRDIHGVNVIKESVSSVDSAGKTVTLSDGTTTVPYDRLILSPGIEFVDVDGWDRKKLPHAWDGSEQTLLLQKQLACFPAGGTLIFNVPNYPFRCPPGVYERASAVADHLRVNNKNAKIIVLDAQADIFVENELFHGIYDDLGVEYIGNTRIINVNSGDDAGNGRSITYVNIEREERTPTNPFPKEIEGSASEPLTLGATVINLIPDNKAAPLIFTAGLVPDGALWAPVNELTYESVMPGKEGMYVLGDSLYTMQSKAGQMANAQAKVCADAILKTHAGEAVYQHPVTTAGGFAPLTQNRVNWIGVSYVYDPNFDRGPLGLGAMVRKVFKSAPEPTEANREQMLKWANNLFADTWG